MKTCRSSASQVGSFISSLFSLGRGGGVPPGYGPAGDCCISPNAVSDLWCIDYEVHHRSVVANIHQGPCSFHLASKQRQEHDAILTPGGLLYIS